MTPKLVRRRSERLQTKRLVCTCPVPCPITCTPQDECPIQETPTAAYAFFQRHHSHRDVYNEEYAYPGLPVQVLEMGDPEYRVSKAKMPLHDMLGSVELDYEIAKFICFELSGETIQGTWAHTLWKTFGLDYVDHIVERQYCDGIILHLPLVLKLAQEIQNYLYADCSHEYWFKSPVPCAICHQIICRDYETTACCQHMIHSMCGNKENQITCPVCKQSCKWRCFKYYDSDDAWETW